MRLLFVFLPTVLPFAAFRSGEPWLDTRGKVIDAHGGGFLVHQGLTYWYGSQRNGWKCCHDGGINLYTSTDLYNWTARGLVLKTFQADTNGSATGNGRDLERPKVVRCAGTGKFVMWVRGTGEGNTPQLAAVAISDSPLGPFTFVGNVTDPFHTIDPGNPNQPVGYQYADATLFQDPTSSKTFVYWRTRVNAQHTGFRAMELTDDCRDVVPASDHQLVRVWRSNSVPHIRPLRCQRPVFDPRLEQFQSPNREAPAVFFARGQYYLWASGTDGWAPTTMHLYTADSPLGAFNRSGLNNSRGWLIGWQPTPIPAPGQPGNTKPDQPGVWAFGSQSTYILPNPQHKEGSKLAPFIYIADRWTPNDVYSMGSYVWLPLWIDPKNSSRVRVVWHESWRLDNATSSPFADGTSVGASPPAPSAAATAVPTVEIAPGVLLPMVTLGGVNSTDYPSYPDYSNYSLWLELGGRGFDSAWEYRTQATVAKAMVASGVPREQLFLTTKIPGSLHGGCCGCPGAGPAGTCLPKCHGLCFPAHGHYTAENATSYIHQNLKILLANGIEYIDLLLLHEPCDYIAPYPYNASAETSDVYGAMEAALLSTDPALMGRIKSIGVSNFNSRMLTLLAVTNKVKPAVNQCRMTVGGYDAATHAYCRQHGITYQAYSTLHGKIDDPAVSTIATAHGVSNAQVGMRWVTQLGVPLVTASENAKYDREDMGIFDFELSQAEMETLTAI